MDDQNFERQAQRIRKACERRGLTLLGIFDDQASGADPLGAFRREGLIDAASRARAEKAVLVIPEPTRLFRNVEAARDFLSKLDVPVFSVREGRFLKGPALLRGIARGEASVHAIRLGTVEALAQKKAEGVEFSNAEVRKKAAKKSADVRSQQAENIAMRVAVILQSDPAYRDLSNRALADLLNRQRILTGWRRPWTEHSVRGARKKAMELIKMMEEVDHMDDGLDLVTDQVGDAVAVDAAPISSQGTAARDGTHRIKASETDDSDDAIDEIEQLRKLPGFGVY